MMPSHKLLSMYLHNSWIYRRIAFAWNDFPGASLNNIFGFFRLIRQKYHSNAYTVAKVYKVAARILAQLQKEIAQGVAHLVYDFFPGDIRVAGEP